MERQENTQSIISALDEIMKDDQTLLPLQRDVLEQFKTAPESHQTGIFDLATGFGKTVIMSALMTAYLRNNPKGKVIVAVPTQTLIENKADGGHIEHLKDFFKSFNQRFSSDELDIGAFYSDKKEPEKQVVITTYSSLNNLRNQINPKEIGLLLLDEAHHTITDKRIAAVKSFTNAAQYGMTATPFYSPEKSLSMVLGNTIAQVDAKKAIQKGLLSNVKNILMVSDISIDLAKELGHKQDYSEEDYKKAIEAALKASSNTNPGNSGNPKNWEEFRKGMAINVAKLYRDYVDENLGALNGKQCMINCRTQEEARIQAEAINTLFGKEVAGWWTTDSDDKTVLDRFSQKRLNVICQVGKLTEGFDDPDIAVCINYPTASQVLEAQRSGRPLHKVQNTSKEALVIDLCFRHPDYDNEVDAIRQNKQQLFMDILGAPVVRCEEIATEKQLDRENHPVLHGYTTTLPKLHGFHIMSSTQELIRLSQEADKLKKERYISPIRPGMRTSVDFHKEFGIRDTLAKKWLEECIGTKFYLDSDTKHEHPLDLVEWVKSGNNPCWALHEGTEALEVFKKWLKETHKRELIIPPIRPGMRTSKDFYKEFGVDPGRVRQWFEECIDTKFYLDSDIKHEHPLDLVEWVKTKSWCCWALHEAPEALEVFIKMHPEIKKSLENKNIPPIRSGMRTSKDFYKEFGVDNGRIKQWLEECIGTKFYLDSDTKHKHPLDLVEWVKNKQCCWALHEAPEALEVFIKMHPEIKKSLENKNIPPIRPGMKTSKDFYKEFGVDPGRIRQWFKECIGTKFYLDSDTKHKHPLELVEWIKIGANVTWALHEAPEALREFIKMHPELEIPRIRSGMRTSKDFYKEFGVGRAKRWLEECIGTKFYLDSDTKHKHPLDLVEWVKTKSWCCWALHEAPEALRTFKEWLKKTHDRELKVRTTSSTLRSRLKAGSTRGKAKATLPRNLSTPEI